MLGTLVPLSTSCHPWSAPRMSVQCPGEQQGNPLSGHWWRALWAEHPREGAARTSLLMHRSASCPYRAQLKNFSRSLGESEMEGDVSGSVSKKCLYTVDLREEDALRCRRSRAHVHRWKDVFGCTCWEECVWGKGAEWREVGCECADPLRMESERRKPLGTEGENVSVNN